MLCSTSESSHVVLFRVRATRGFEGTSYSNWATSAYIGHSGHAIPKFPRQAISWSMSIFSHAVGSKARNETNRMPPVPQNIDDWLYLLYVSIFWRSWNLRLFLVHHKKWFLHLRSLQQSSCIYRASPKNISWNLWCLEQLFWKINNNILESYWTHHRFPTLYQTTILGARWDFTRVINIKKSCQANYQ